MRTLKNLFSQTNFAKTKSENFPIVLYKHRSLIRRQLGNVDMHLQENKAVNLSLAAPKVNCIVIKPGETFSFWKCVGSPSKAAGYREGLTISVGSPSKGIGGGMCQFTNLLHWLALHSPLDIVEHHHHDGVDLFPDYGRQVPFGCGTSILYNYLDYRLKNNTEIPFQFIVFTTETHLCGELRASRPLEFGYHIDEEEARFVKLGDDYYRRNKILRKTIDKHTGDEITRELLKESNAKVFYDEKYIDKALVRME